MAPESPEYQRKLVGVPGFFVETGHVTGHVATWRRPERGAGGQAVRERSFPSELPQPGLRLAREVVMFPSLFTPHTAVRPSVWVGCLACFTADVLRGVWTPAENAAAITPADLQEWESAHDELRVFDHEGLPSGIGEIPPSTAQLWGEVFNEVGEEK